MTQQEAFQTLGLAPTAAPHQIDEAARRLLARYASKARWGANPTERDAATKFAATVQDAFFALTGRKVPAGGSPQRASAASSSIPRTTLNGRPVPHTQPGPKRPAPAPRQAQPAQANSTGASNHPPGRTPIPSAANAWAWARRIARWTLHLIPPQAIGVAIVLIFLYLSIMFVARHVAPAISSASTGVRSLGEGMASKCEQWAAAAKRTQQASVDARETRRGAQQAAHTRSRSPEITHESPQNSADAAERVTPRPDAPQVALSTPAAQQASTPPAAIIGVPVLTFGSPKPEEPASSSKAWVVAKSTPWARVYIDGRHIGDSPWLEPIAIPPGRHEVRVATTTEKTAERFVEFEAGKVTILICNFSGGVFGLKTVDKESY